MEKSKMTRFHEKNKLTTTYLCCNHESCVSRRGEEDDGAVDELVRVITAENDWAALGHIFLTNDYYLFEELMH